MPSSSKFTTIMLGKELVTRMREIRTRIEEWTGHSMSWGDFIKVLLAVYEARTPETWPQVAVMGSGKPMTEEELEEAGVEEIPGLSITLSEEDRDRIAELVVEKLREQGVSRD